MMRAFLLLALLLLPAAAADDLRMLRLRRLAMEAQLRIGDTLRQKGDLAGARAAYEEAIRLERAFAVGPEVRAALRWLALHQEADGRWDCDRFQGSEPYDTGVTGLAVLAFLRAGEGEATPVAKGLAFLVASQDAEGCIGRVGRHFIYNHAVATAALVEAFAATREERWKAAAQKGIKFLEAARNPYMGWRYEVRGGDNDTSVTCWCAQALAAGRRAGLAVEEGALEGARAWIDKMTDAEFGQVGYNMPGGASARPAEMADKFPVEKTQAMTAAALATRIALGEDPRQSPAIQKGVALCLRLPPVWNADDGSIDMYYWHHATEAMAHVGGDRWIAWQRALELAAAAGQCVAGENAGSWDPVDPWGPDGGRVYSTALMALSLTTATARAGPR
jgi:hypothetical protein